MFLISWNVAGWSSTCSKIRENFGSITEFLSRTHADIVCLQEVKGMWQKLNDNPHAMGARDAPVDITSEWELFWSFSSAAHRGFNGVATFARKNLTWSCDPRPFTDADDVGDGDDICSKDPLGGTNVKSKGASTSRVKSDKVCKSDELNDEGRVLVTCHSEFILINTYVVNGRHGRRTAFMMRFVSSLKNLIARLRCETGKPVILVGDMNMSYRTQDAHWLLRRLSLSRVAELAQFAKHTDSKEWAERFPHLPAATVTRLESLIAEQIMQLILGNTKATPDADYNSISVDGIFFAGSSAHTSSDGISALVQRVREHQKQSTDQCALTSLSELCEAGVASVCVKILTKVLAAKHRRDLFALTQYCGLPAHDDRLVEFMRVFLSELHLCDSMLVQDANARTGNEFSVPCPYTCWDQSTNRRQTNEGCRIDYILIDEQLVHMLVPCRATENNMGVADVDGSAGREGEICINESKKLNSEAESAEKDTVQTYSTFYDEYNGQAVRIGIKRATAAGAYPAAPMDRTGLPPLTSAAKDLQFRGLPSTGLYVTPPQYSDHCAVCARFEDLVLLPRTEEVKGKHRCLYRPPASLFSFVKRQRE
ncbi:putative Endonuclease Exonuclease phosphatase family [Trypanosoma vivax]|uniref:Putative DNA-(Apurinic or apyrimidinic site) lyase n=1 Tax=Trypanosoma vivax (strain Y486) TaxID=1055687 RepID=G0UCW2_TRYVY|nr:putative DNA-(apurinic or apyrimidinic site) lyase [Trypanosoma vivax]KAH8608324.1 putative Endonuclease Exonuclease phosphatase family [Trypanosoma vivax]CCC53672.1 putative DNA-(apurinic or apyrimidinic site) lyase [Trypanosoma vivax Y486]